MAEDRGEVRDLNSPLEVATRYITDVSKRFRGSVVGQGAALVELCRRDGQDPQILKAALLSRPDRVGRLARSANIHHRNIDMLPVDGPMVGSVSGESFDWARDMMILDQADLDEIKAGFEPSRASREARRAYDARAREIINAKRDTLNTASEPEDTST